MKLYFNLNGVKTGNTVAKINKVIWIPSNLEFCSSIYLGLPQSSLMKLQRVINSTFRSIHHLRKSDHISDLQRSKGCRSIEQRISTRVATILFVALKWKVPHYISEWITPYSSSLRSNSKCLLVCPYSTSVSLELRRSRGL
jgi:hypothetical protein